MGYGKIKMKKAGMKPVDTKKMTKDVKKFMKTMKYKYGSFKMDMKYDKGGFGMLSVKAGIDNNPAATQADRIAGAKMKSKKKMGMGGKKMMMGGTKKKMGGGYKMRK